MSFLDDDLLDYEENKDYDDLQYNTDDNDNKDFLYDFVVEEDDDFD
jgi:hypothetical protein